jgi:hypothetical protein
MTSEAAKGASAPVPRKERGEAVAVSRKKSPLQKPQAVTEEAQGTGGESGPVPAPVAQGEAKRGEDLNPAGAPSIPARTATSSFLHIADREVVANAAATLPRGTLLRARLTRELDPARGPGVFGVVAEDVVRNGVVMVEKGSVLDCRALAILNERVSISCDGVKASETRLSFTAIGLGEGDRPGLRAIDGVVPSGTPFVVCVTASAILE